MEKHNVSFIDEYWDIFLEYFHAHVAAVESISLQ